MTDPTPATPDEAVAALRSIFGHAKACRELMPTDGRCNCMDILAAAGWSLSRQQGDTVAALAARIRMHGVASHGASYWRPTDGHLWDWDTCPHGVCAEDRRVIADALGIGADGAGDGR